jgi:hypothetical protein
MNKKKLVEDLTNFSFCFRIKLYRLRGEENIVISYAHAISDNALIVSEYHDEISSTLNRLPPARTLRIKEMILQWRRITHP